MSHCPPSHLSHIQLGAMPSRPCSPTRITGTKTLLVQNPTAQKTHGGWEGREGQAMAEGNKNN